MADLYTRISKRINMTVTAFRSDCRISAKLALLRMCADLGGRLGLRSISVPASKKKEAFIQKHLEKALGSVLEHYVDDSDHGTFEPDGPIWVCWWTGEETAPALVKRCIRSIRENAGDRLVHMITRDNYKEYLDIPTYILNKVQNGSMCVANFSDYLRFSLLAKYGGQWLDATLFCSAPIPADYAHAPLFTCKGTMGDPSGYLSLFRWTSFCFGGYRGNVLFRYMSDAFDAYWREHDISIDYLLVDYLIDLGYRKLPAVRQLLDAVPDNNLHRDDLQAAMNAALPATDFDAVIQPDTTLYKLSWREAYAETTADGQESIFAYFINEKRN